VQRFQSFWFGAEITQYQRLAMKSFVDFGHQYILYAYRKFDVPAGVAVRDAAEILPQRRVFFYGDKAGLGRGSISGFSNLFRYHLLHRMGGWWVDADVVCLSENVPSGEIFMGWEYDDLIGTALLKFPARHPFVQKLRDVAEEAGTEVGWAETGPSLLTRLATEHGLSQGALPQSQSYPLQSVHALHLFIPAYREQTCNKVRGKPFLHLWNEVWRRAVVLSWMAPPPGSLIADLCERHGVGFDNAPAYTADQIQRLSDNYHARADQESDAHESPARQARRAEFARLQDEVRRAQIEATVDKAEVVRLARELKITQSQVDGLDRDLERLRRQIDALQTSTSWRMTGPMRRLATLLRWRALP